MDFLSKLDWLMKRDGLNRHTLAQRSGVQEDALYNILCKKRKMTASELLSLSAVLHLTFDDYRPQKAV